MKIVCLSDTHTYGRKIQVPDGDVLIHSGDLTFRGTQEEIEYELAWLESLPHKHKLFIAGNHDFYFDERFETGTQFRNWEITRKDPTDILLWKFPSLTYLQDSSVTIEGVKFYGSPWQPNYYDWAFQFPKRRFLQSPEAEAKWAEIPDDVEVLITHGPPNGVLDWACDADKLGDIELRKRLADLRELKLHVFGHIHEAYGSEVREDRYGKILFVNAASNNIDYRPVNKPIVIEKVGDNYEVQANTGTGEQD